MAMRGDEPVNFIHASAQAEAIAILNDQLRKRGLGGQIVLTVGVAALPNLDVEQLLVELAQYSSFNADNDPYGERDFGRMQACGADLFWKIDYYDLNIEYASPDPADPQVTIRVLTIMLTSEY